MTTDADWKAAAELWTWLVEEERQQLVQAFAAHAEAARREEREAVVRAMFPGTLSLGPNGYGGSKIVIDFAHSTDAMACFELLSGETATAIEQGAHHE